MINHKENVEYAIIWYCFLIHIGVYQMSKTIHNIIKKAISTNGKYKECKVEYAIDEDLNTVIGQGSIKFVDDYGDQLEYSEIYNNPTYLDLAIFVNDRINESGDNHHTFLEGMYRYAIENEGTENEIHVYTYALGS